MNLLGRPVAILTLLAFLNGCASQPLPSSTSRPTGDRAIPRDIVVTAARFQPEADIELLLRTKGELAGAGAGAGALEGAGALMQGAGSCGDPYCGAAILLLLPVFMGVGAVIGAVRDAPSAATQETIESGQKAMQDGIAQLNLQRMLQGSLVKELQAQGVTGNLAEEWDVGPATPEETLTYESINPGTNDAILEVSVLEFQFKKIRLPNDKKIRYQLSMLTRIRLLAPTTRQVLDEMNYVHVSGIHTATEWLSNNASLFVAALEEAIRDTSQITVNEIFLLYYPNEVSEAKPYEKQVVPEYVLRPMYPLPTRSFDLRGAFVDKYRTSWGGLEFVPVDSLTPTLHWEAFPRTIDIASMGGHADRFSNVQYEVIVYEALSTNPIYQPGPIIYHRPKLVEQAHQLEISLDPCRRYFWTVRAHFKLDGWPRVTEWTGAYDVFKTAKPWEYRRGLRGSSLFSFDLEPRRMSLPFRAPTGYGAECE